MQPLYLKLEGLNSFSAAQEVDFAKLSSRGLFGIFGPTGSGKSTLLDAIVLALYGRIPRMGTRLQGVINTGCDFAHVEYRFALNSGPKRGCYRVERTLRRQKNRSVHTDQSLLAAMQADGSYEVLAEQTLSVNRAVEELIGLTADDFLRSAVLPQGSFSQFLHLSGSERSNMLERLFALEAYGQNLTAQLKRMQNAASGELQALEGALSAFAAVTPAAVRGVQRQWQQLRTREDRLRISWQQLQGQYEELHQVWLWSQELETVQQDLAALQTEADVQQRRKTRYERWQRAAGLKENAIDLGSLEERLEIVQLGLEGSRAELRRWGSLFADREAEYERLAYEREHSLPAWQEQRLQLKQAVEAQSRSHSLEETIAQLQDELQQTQEQQRSAQQRWVELEQNYQQQLQLCRQQEEQWEQVKISAEQRRQLDQVINQEKTRAELNKQHEDIRADIQAVQNSLEELQELRQRCLQEQQEQNTILLQQERQLSEQRQILKAGEERWHHWEQEHFALQLAAELETDRACPVCGSLEHPFPAMFPPDHAERQKQLQQDREEARQAVQQSEQQWQVCRQYLERLKVQLELQQPELEQLTLKLQDLYRQQKGLQENSRPIMERCDRYRRQYNYQDLTQLQAAITQRDRRSDDLSRQLQSARQHLEQRQQAKIRQQQELDELKHQLEMEKQQLQQYGQQRAELQQQFSQYGDVQIRLTEIEAQISNYRERYQQIESEYTSCRDNLRHAEEHMDMQQRLYKDTRDEWQRRKAVFRSKMEQWGFSDETVLKELFAQEEEIQADYEIWQRYQQEVASKAARLSHLQRQLGERAVSQRQWQEFQQLQQQTEQQLRELSGKRAASQEQLLQLLQARRQQQELKQRYEPLARRSSWLNELERLLKGKKFVDYIARQQLQYILAHASQTLREMSSGRYTLEMGDDSEFVICDAYNAGARRSVKTLSGGETFLASLALALALSAHIQLGQANLEFFFLDEGFGSLDADMLETVMNALEKLRQQHHMAVGLISHMEAIKERIEYSLTVIPADTVRGSRLIMNAD